MPPPERDFDTLECDCVSESPFGACYSPLNISDEASKNLNVFARSPRFRKTSRDSNTNMNRFENIWIFQTVTIMDRRLRIRMICVKPLTGGFQTFRFKASHLLGCCKMFLASMNGVQRRCESSDFSGLHASPRFPLDSFGRFPLTSFAIGIHFWAMQNLYNKKK
jgi:hypothetical protein